jgi:hypothetical protein
VSNFIDPLITPDKQQSMILLTKEMQVQEGEQFHFAVVMTRRHHFFQTIYNMLYIYKKSEMHHVSSQYASHGHTRSAQIQAKTMVRLSGPIVAQCGWKILLPPNKVDMAQF